MDRYKPPYEITDTMTTLISDISEKVGRIDASGKSVTMPHLRCNTQIRSIHSSLRIEANSLTADQVRDVIDGKSVAGPASEILEVKNAYEAYSQIGCIDPYQISELKRLHGIMTKDLITGYSDTGEPCGDDYLRKTQQQKPEISEDGAVKGANTRAE